MKGISAGGISLDGKTKRMHAYNAYIMLEPKRLHGLQLLCKNLLRSMANVPESLVCEVLLLKLS